MLRSVINIIIIIMLRSVINKIIIIIMIISALSPTTPPDLSSPPDEPDSLRSFSQSPSLYPGGARFSSRHVVPKTFPAGRVTMGEVTVLVFPFPPVGIVPPRLHAHVHLNNAFIRRTSGRRPGTFEAKWVSFRSWEAQKKIVYIYELHVHDIQVHEKVIPSTGKVGMTVRNYQVSFRSLYVSEMF